MLPQRLEENETLINLAEDTRGMRTGLLAITDRRVIHLYKRSEKPQQFFELAIGDIETVRASRGFAGRFNRKLVLHMLRQAERIVLEDITPRERTAEIADYLRSRIEARNTPNQPD